MRFRLPNNNTRSERDDDEETEGAYDHNSVRGVTVDEFAPYLVTLVEYLFALLAQQAQRGLNTNRTEDELTTCKIAMKILQKHKTGWVIPSHIVRNADRLPLPKLSELPMDAGHCVENESGELYGAYSFVLLRKDYAVCVRGNKEVVLPTVKWDGKRLVALHTDNLPRKFYSLIEDKRRRYNSADDEDDDIDVGEDAAPRGRLRI